MMSICKSKLRRLNTVMALVLSVGLVACQPIAQTQPAPIAMTAARTIAVNYNNNAIFSVGVVPTQAPPIRIGTPTEFTMSSSASGYGYLYLINASGNVLVLAENLAMAADRQVIYPPPSDGITLRATPPAGAERVILLVTRQPFIGFSESRGATSTKPVMLPVSAADFIQKLNDATAALPVSTWSIAEARIEIVASASGPQMAAALNPASTDT